MTDSFYETLIDFERRRESHAVATVVNVHGSASARPGAKALISCEGRNVLGWIGGGCAESLVIQNALIAMESGECRIVEVDLNDEVLGAGMPCGGSMDVFVEPILPRPRVFLFGDDGVSTLLAQWAYKCGFDVEINSEAEIMPVDFVVLRDDSLANPRLPKDFSRLISKGLLDVERTAAETALSLTARLLQRYRQSSGQPLWKVKKMPPECKPRPTGDDLNENCHLILVGHNRMTEALAEIATALEWEVSVNSPGATTGDYSAAVCRILNDDAYELSEVTRGCSIVIATQHKGDHRVLKSVLSRDPGYIGLIASRRRAGLIVDYLSEEGLSEAARNCLHAPCGLDLGAQAPFEVAISIISEIVARRN